MPNGQLVTTMNQTAGRGQLDNKWESEKFKNLTFSIGIIDLDFPVQFQFQLNVITSLAVVKTINENFGTTAQIKWPNDVLIGGKKLCGILIETSIKQGLIYSAVLGIGLNVNQEVFKTENAVSLFNVLGQVVDPEEVLKTLCENIEHFIFRKEDLKGLKSLYLKELFRFDEESTYMVDGHEISGKIVDVNDRGELVLEVENDLMTFEPKQIKFVL